MAQKISYADLDILEMITIPNAPKEIEDSLKSRTRGTNRLVTVVILSCLGQKIRARYQSSLVKRVQKSGINLTPTRIIEYLTELEKSNIVKSKKAYTREYSLTEKGKWCYKAVTTCFPKRQFWFITRHYLAYRNLPPFPVDTKEGTTQV
jgi:predicted transcriptional regulator